MLPWSVSLARKDRGVSARSPNTSSEKRERGIALRHFDFFFILQESDGGPDCALNAAAARVGGGHAPAPGLLPARKVPHHAPLPGGGRQRPLARHAAAARRGGPTHAALRRAAPAEGAANAHLEGRDQHG